MSSDSAPTRRSHLALGAALLGCSLASTDALGGAPAMRYTTVNSLTATMTAGSSSFTYTLPAASNGFYYSYNTPGGVNHIVGGIAYGGPTSDWIGISLDSGLNTYASGTGSATISLTFSADVTFSDFGLFLFGISSGWEYGGSALTNGQLFVASGSPYVFTVNYAYSGTASNYFASYGLFTLAAAPAVPLPGAAGLAACGLLGLGRRRRR